MTCDDVGAVEVPELLCGECGAYWVCEHMAPQEDDVVARIVREHGKPRVPLTVNDPPVMYDGNGVWGNV